MIKSVVFPNQPVVGASISYTFGNSRAGMAGMGMPGMGMGGFR